MYIAQHHIAFAVKTARDYIAIGKDRYLVAQAVAEAIAVSFGFIDIWPFKMLCHTKENSVFESKIELAAVAGFHFVKFCIYRTAQVKIKT